MRRNQLQEHQICGIHDRNERGRYRETNQKTVPELLVHLRGQVAL